MTQQYMHKIKRRILRRMTSFGRTKVKKTSKSIQVYRIRESPFSKGLQEYTRVSLAIKKIPNNEVLTERQVRKTQCLCGFRDFQNQINLPLYTKFTPIGAKNGAETKKSHNFKFHTAPEKLLLLRSFFHFS